MREKVRQTDRHIEQQRVSDIKRKKLRFTLGNIYPRKESERNIKRKERESQTEILK